MQRRGQIVQIPKESLIYKNKLRIFDSKLEELLENSKEKSYSLFDGFLVGDHPGVNNFIIGQRKGLNVGGKKEPLYVIGIDANDNRIFVGEGEGHPGLQTNVLKFDEVKVDWISCYDLLKKQLEVGINVDVIREGEQEILNAKLYGFEKLYFLEFEKPVSILKKYSLISLRFQDYIIINIK